MVSRILVGLGALAVGAILGAVIGGRVLGGAMMGAGVAVGLSSGICTTVEAAQKEGIMTAEQVDRVMNRAAHHLAAGNGAQVESIAGGAAACDAALERLRQAQSS